MAISEMNFVDVLAAVEDLTLPQAYKVLLAMKQNPPENTDVVKEAVASFEALEDLEIYHFFKEMRKRFDAEEWATLTED